MRDIRNMTLKDLIIHAKRNLTLEETATDEYGVTKEELRKKIDILLKDHPQKKKEIYDAFEANIKKPHKKSTQTLQSTQEEAEEQNIIEEPKDSVLVLREEEQTLSEEVSELERQFYDARNDGRTVRIELRELDDKIQELRRQAEVYSKEYHELSDKLDGISEVMNGITDLRRTKLERLSEVRREIEERTDITICVTNDGNIEAPDNANFVVDTDGYLDIKAKISEREECLDLTMRQITTLAKLIKVAEKTERFTLICDSEELEAVFWAIWNNQ